MVESIRAPNRTPRMLPDPPVVAHAAQDDRGQGHHLPVTAEIDRDRPNARDVEEGGKPHERAAGGERKEDDRLARRP